MLDLGGALETTNSTIVPRVLALHHPLGIAMVWTMVMIFNLEVEYRLMGIMHCN